MDLRNLISSNDDDTPARPPAPQPRPLPQKALSSSGQNSVSSVSSASASPHLRHAQPRLSIQNLMNNDGHPQQHSDSASASPTANSIPLKSAKVSGSVTSSPVTPHNEIKRRSSISTITNDEDVDMSGHKIPSAIRRHSSTTDILKIDDGRNVEVRAQNSIEAEIQDLQELQKKEQEAAEVHGKPKRYKQKPVWACDYVPKLLVQNTHHHSRKSAAAAGNTKTKLAVPSISGTIPRDDFNKVVTQWIWANVQRAKEDNVQIPNVENHIELELKVGCIWDKVRDRRVQLPVSTECVVNPDFVHRDCRFKSGIPSNSYSSVKSYLQKITQDSQGGSRKDKMIVETSHNVDLIAPDSEIHNKLVNERVTLDVKTKRRVASIEKERVADLYIHLPNTLFDLRLSMSLELPREMNDEAFAAFKSRVSIQRDKDRVSYIHPDTATRIDVTKIKENGSSAATYELELEMITPELLRSIAMLSDDPLYYVDLVQAFLDNGRIITRQLSVQQF